MSASPAERTPGPTPNGTLPPIIRRPKAADPLVRPKKRERKTQKPPLPPSSAPNGINGNLKPNGLPNLSKTQVLAQHPSRPLQSDLIPGFIDPSQSGFSSAPVAPYTDFPLIMTKKALGEGLRNHVARFYSKKDIDPRNEEEFTRPVRLHRRDARIPPGGVKEDEDKDGLDAEEREKKELEKARRDAEYEAQMALVAPSQKSGRSTKFGASKKKTQQVRRNDQTEEQKAGTKLRYEEALPWHVEDFDNKQTWVGSYEAALSETQAQLVLRDGKYYITPVEKWYKFTPKAPFAALTIDEAEKRMEKKVKDPRWFMESLADNQKKLEDLKNKKAASKLFVGKVHKSNEDSGRIRSMAIKREAGDNDDLDFEEDRFADDEENPIIEGEDEDTKEAEARIKNDQLQANVFDLKDEKVYDKADQLAEKQKRAEKVLGKKVKKALMKREKNYIYDSDDSENPYSEESDSTDSEEERLKEEQLKKEAEEKKNASTNLTDKTKTLPPSGASTKGTNTPSNRPSKHLDATQKPSSQASLKRPGSPNLSEQSGNESSRKKKLKNKHGQSSTLGTGTATPNGPPSRPRSPIPPPASSATDPAAQIQRKASVVKPQVSDHASNKPGRPDNKRSRTGGAGSGSEGEGARSSAEMSDGSRKRIKLHLSPPGSKTSTPRGSRAVSPDVPSTQPTAAASGSATPAIADPDDPAFPTMDELKAKIPPEGITIKELTAYFPGRVQSDERRKRLTNVLRKIAKYDGATKLLRPR